tara:strand:+ start:722 stop:1873 length:1152 start_codon:yes stop_codon:yes gene_type:complete
LISKKDYFNIFYNYKMNSAYTAQNDINSFRSGLQNEHDTFAAGLQGKQNSYLNHIQNVKQEWTGKIDSARSTLESAQELLKTGFESEAGIAGGAIASKATIHLKRVVSGTHDYRGNLTEKGKAIGRRNLQSAQEENATTPGENNPSGNNIARPEGGNNTGEGADSGGGREMGQIGRNKPSNQFTRDTFDEKTGLRGSPQADPTTGETKSNFGTNDDGYGESKTTSTESKGADFGDDSTDAADSLAKNVGSDVADDAAAAAKKAAGNALGDLGDSVAKNLGTDALETAGKVAGQAAGDAVLDAAAAAFSWVPFVGEVLTGAAAIVGIGTAIAGGIDTIKAGAAEKADEAAGDAATAVAQAARPTTSQLNYAGGYVAPAVSSIQT